MESKKNYKDELKKQKQTQTKTNIRVSKGKGGAEE